MLLPPSTGEGKKRGNARRQPSPPCATPGGTTVCWVRRQASLNRNNNAENKIWVMKGDGVERKKNQSNAPYAHRTFS